MYYKINNTAGIVLTLLTTNLYQCAMLKYNSNYILVLHK